RTNGTVGQPHLARHLASEVVRMRLHGEHLRIDRQHVAVANLVGRIPCWNVDRFASEPQAERHSGWWRVGEEEADAHLYWFGLAGRLKMQLHDKIAFRFESPRHAV